MALTHIPRVREWLRDAQEKLIRVTPDSQRHAELVRIIADYEELLKRMEGNERQPGQEA